MSNNKGKLIFFDIDGTLVGFDGKIPKSTYKALDMARSKGNKVFICTGRSKCQIYDFLIDYGFDGIIAATGAYVEYKGKLISHDTIGDKDIARLIGYFDSQNIAYTLQAADNQISSEDNLKIMKKLINEQLKASGREDNPNAFADVVIADDLTTNPAKYGYAEKAIYYASAIPIKEVESALSPYFDVTASSFEKPDETSGEVTMAGINKAYGMKVIGDYLGISKADMIAFGDGPNDIDMLEYAGVGIAMGNAGEYTKSAADMVTDRISEDGIYNALEKLGIIII
jgi:Cof subfamily protein (haloacid dehalogenase superfamily)